MSADLKIRVISHLKESQHFMLYQEKINLSVKSFLIGAWKQACIAPGAEYDILLPSEIYVQGRQHVDKGSMKTKLQRADINTAWSIFDNKNAIDIEYCSDINPTDNTIDINNTCQETRIAVALKGEKPIFACEVRPLGKVNFVIYPKLYLALSDFFIKNDFFEAATISRKFEFDYEEQNSITITLKENNETGAVLATADYGQIYDFSV